MAFQLKPNEIYSTIRLDGLVISQNPFKLMKEIAEELQEETKELLKIIREAKAEEK